MNSRLSRLQHALASLGIFPGGSSDSLIPGSTWEALGSNAPGGLTLGGDPIGSALTVPYGGDVGTPDVYIGAAPSVFTASVAADFLAGDQMNVAFHGPTNNRFSAIQVVLESTDFGTSALQAASFSAGGSGPIGVIGLAGNSGASNFGTATGMKAYVQVRGSGDIAEAIGFSASGVAQIGGGSGAVAAYISFQANDAPLAAINYGFYSLNDAPNWAFYWAGTAPIHVGGFIEGAEAAEPAAPAANSYRLFAVDSGGKTKLMVRFASGASQQIAIEP